jgi:hypothetical protein
MRACKSSVGIFIMTKNSRVDAKQNINQTNGKGIVTKLITSKPENNTN